MPELQAGADQAAVGHTALRLVSWNIHSGRGRDGRYDLARIERVLRGIDADLVALQEVDAGIARSQGQDQAEALAAGLAMQASFCATRRFGDGRYGLAVLSRQPAVAVQQYDLSYGVRHEPRSCLRVDVRIGEAGPSLHLFNCHLGLAALERRWQRRRMLSDALLLSEELHHPVLLLGDFNDRPLPVVHSRLRDHFVDAFRASGRRRGGATFRLGPFGLRLDHIYVGPGVGVRDCVVRSDGEAALASDHLPLLADIELPLAAREAGEAC